MTNDFICPVCGKKLDFVEYLTYWNSDETVQPVKIECRCDNCKIKSYGANEFQACLKFLESIPPNFYLLKLIDNLDAVNSNLIELAGIFMEK